MKFDNSFNIMSFTELLVLCAISIAVVSCQEDADVIKLAPFPNLDSRVTLSGFSSGGGLAQQLLVSYPSLFAGIAVFQQIFYRCGPPTGNVAEFDNACTKFVNSSVNVGPYDPKDSVKEILSNFEKGLIEDPRNLHSKRLYVYIGRNNVVFTPEMMLKILDVFEPFIQNPNAIRTRVQNIGLSMPTYDYGVDCPENSGDTYHLANCKLNGPYDALNFLLGDRILYPYPQAPMKSTFNINSLKQFDQEEFMAGIDGAHLMAPTGYIYIPKACETGRGSQQCLLHFYFHGCLAGSSFHKDKHLLHSGFLELAELNNIIIVFPQAQKTDVNYLGCWDSFGLTGPLYATQQGIQVTVMKRILYRLLGLDENGNPSSAPSRNPTGFNLQVSLPFTPLIMLRNLNQPFL